jgi:hypothetical protein
VSAEISTDGVGQATVRATHLGSDYRPALNGGEPTVAAADFEPLPAHEYDAKIVETWLKQRMAVYWFALRHVGHFPRSVLFQLGRQTVGNKLRALLRI